MRGVFEDLMQSFRLLWRQPGFTFAALLLLALGIGLASAIFSLVNTVLLRPLPFRDSERIYYAWTRSAQKARKQGAFSPGEFLDYRSQIKSFEAFAAFCIYRATWTMSGAPSRVARVLVTEGYFDVLGLTPAMGRSLVKGDFVSGQNNVVLLSDSFWTERMGRNPDAIGQPVVLDGVPHTVVGILPPLKSEFTSGEVYVPIAFTEKEIYARSARYLFVIGRLKRGASQQQAQSELDAAAKFIAERSPESNTGWSAYVVEAKEEIVGGARRPILVLFAAAGLLLLVACANLANLFMVRLSGRGRDIAVRSAMGASQGRIFRQHLAESLTVACLGGTAGLVVAYLTLRAVVKFSPTALPRAANPRLDPEVILFAFGLSFVCALLFGAGPALRSLNLNLASSLRDESRSSTGGRTRSRGRNLLIISEVALSVVLLVCAGLLTRTFLKLASMDLGYDPAGVLTARTTLPDSGYTDEPPRVEYVRKVLERMRAMPGVQAAGVGTSVPMLQINWTSDFMIEGGDDFGGQGRSVSYHAVSPGFMEAIGARLVRGRMIDERDLPDAPKVVLINRELERQYFPDGSALGKKLRVKVSLHDFRAEIVGVVETIRQLRPEESPRPALYQPHAQNPWPFLAFVVKGRGGESAIIAGMRQAFSEADANLPVDRIVPLSSFLGDAMRQKQLAFSLLAIFSALAVVLSLVGLYSVLSMSLAQRRRELGIRMALGADRGTLTLMVVRQGGLLAVAGLAAGLLAAPLSSRALESMLVGVTPVDPLTYVAVTALVLLASLLASLIPAWRGSNVNPVDALRDA